MLCRTMRTSTGSSDTAEFLAVDIVANWREGVGYGSTNKKLRSTERWSITMVVKTGWKYDLVDVSRVCQGQCLWVFYTDNEEIVRDREKCLKFGDGWGIVLCGFLWMKKGRKEKKRFTKQASCRRG